MKEIIIGDIHGDFHAWRSILHHSGCIDEQGMWVGVHIRLIQLGDIFDLGGRGVPYKDRDDEWAILSDIIQYSKTAPHYQSEVHFVLGNHEWMNVNGDFYFVSPEAMKHSLTYYKKWTKRFPKFKTTIHNDADARLAIVGKGKPVAILLADYGKAMVRIDNRLYVHGGILPDHARMCTDIDHVNALLKGVLKDTHPYELMSMQDREIFKLFFKDGRAIWYTRQIAFEQIPYNDVKTTLHQFGVNHLFVGHTPQFEKGMRTIYQGMVHLCDSGHYAAYGRKTEETIQYGVFNETTQQLDTVIIPYKGI